MHERRAYSHFNPACSHCNFVGTSESGTPSGLDATLTHRYNCENGGPAPEKLTNAIFANTGKLNQYYIAAEELEVDLSKPGSARFLVQHHATAKFGEFVVQARPASVPTSESADSSRWYAWVLRGLKFCAHQGWPLFWWVRSARLMYWNIYNSQGLQHTPGAVPCQN